MIAALICVISVAALLQFFVSYSRSVIAAYRKAELSESVREVVGIASSDRLSSEQFGHLLQLVRLCPPRKADDRIDLRVIRTYYWLMGVLHSVACRLAPGITSWAENERVDCAYFVAVALDRRIAYSRELITQQMANR